MRKRTEKSKKFKIFCSPSSLEKPYSLMFSGYVHYWEYAPDYRADSDWDYQGYNEFDSIEFIYINKFDKFTGEEDFLEESEVDPFDFEVFSLKLNLQFGF